MNPEENETNLSTFSVSACHFPDVFEEGGPNLEKGGSKTMDKSQILRSSKSEVTEKSRNFEGTLKPNGDILKEGARMERGGSDHCGGNFYPIKNRVISPSITANGDTKRYDQMTGANLGSLNFKSRAWKAKLGYPNVVTKYIDVDMKSNVDSDNHDPMDAYDSLTRQHEANSYQDSRLPKKVEFNVGQQRHLHQNFSITHKLPLSETPTDSKCNLIKTS